MPIRGPRPWKGKSDKPVLGYGFVGAYIAKMWRAGLDGQWVYRVGVAKEGFEKRERPFDDFSFVFGLAEPRSPQQPAEPPAPSHWKVALPLRLIYT